MPLDRVGKVRVCLDITLVTVGLLDQVVERHKRKAADRRAGAIGTGGAGEPVKRSASVELIAIERNPGHRGGTATRQVAARIAQRRKAGRIDRIGNLGERALARLQFGAVLPADPGQNIQRPEVVPNEEAGVVIVLRSIDDLVIALRLHAAEIAFGDKVRNAADRVRSISRGGAVLEYLDPV